MEECRRQPLMLSSRKGRSTWTRKSTLSHARRTGCKSFHYWRNQDHRRRMLKSTHLGRSRQSTLTTRNLPHTPFQTPWYRWGMPGYTLLLLPHSECPKHTLSKFRQCSLYRLCHEMFRLHMTGMLTRTEKYRARNSIHGDQQNRMLTRRRLRRMRSMRM